MTQNQSAVTTYAYEEIGYAIENLQRMHDQIVGKQSKFGANSAWVSPLDVRSALDDLCLDLAIPRANMPPLLLKLYNQTAKRDSFVLAEVIITFNEARGIARPKSEPPHSAFIDGEDGGA